MQSNMVEVTRSFTYKLNTGNYQSRDFFCSQKKECKEEDAEKISEGLYAFCVREVMKGVNTAIAEMAGTPRPF